MFRIARDMGLVAYAQTSLDHLKRLTPLLEEAADSEKRIRTLELSVRLLSEQHVDPKSRLELVEDAAQHTTEILQGRDEILPATALLAQCIGLLEHSGGTARQEVYELLEEALGRVEASQAKYVRALAAGDPTIEDTLHLSRRLYPTRNTGDVPGDLRVAEISARRLLKADVASLSPETAATTLELIADHALDPLIGARELDTHWPLAFAHSVCPPLGVLM
ncbi:hypothetical protein RYF45_24695, partial [Pseudomonas syringae pv. actinidiae]|nr:hypothetical protein [Pseudomonas syringae pv. actinidiae]